MSKYVIIHNGLVVSCVDPGRLDSRAIGGREDGISAPLGAVYGVQGFTTALVMDGFDVWAASEVGNVGRFNIKADRMIWSAPVAAGKTIHRLALQGSNLVVASSSSLSILNSRNGKVLRRWSPEGGESIDYTVHVPDGPTVVCFQRTIVALDLMLKEQWRYMSKKHNFDLIEVCGGPDSDTSSECLVVGTIKEKHIVAINAATGVASPRTRYWPPHELCLGFETLGDDLKDAGRVLCMGTCMGGFPSRPCIALGMDEKIVCIDMSSLATVWACGTPKRMPTKDGYMTCLAVAGCQVNDSSFVVACGSEGVVLTLDARDGAILAVKLFDSETGDVAAPTVRRVAIRLPKSPAAAAGSRDPTKPLPAVLAGSVRVAVMPQAAAAGRGGVVAENPLASRSTAVAAPVAGQAGRRASDAGSVSSATTAGGPAMEYEDITSACIVPASRLLKQRGGAALLALSDPQPPALIALTAKADALGSFAECILAPMPQLGAAVARPKRSPAGGPSSAVAPGAKAKHLRLWRALRQGAEVEQVAVDEGCGVAVVRSASRGLEAWSLVTGRELWRVSVKDLHVTEPVTCKVYHMELNERAGGAAATAAALMPVVAAEANTPGGHGLTPMHGYGFDGPHTVLSRPSPGAAMARGLLQPAGGGAGQLSSTLSSLEEVGADDEAEEAEEGERPNGDGKTEIRPGGAVGLASGAAFNFERDVGLDDDLDLDSVGNLSGMSDLSGMTDLMADLPSPTSPAAQAAATSGSKPSEKPNTATTLHTMKAHFSTCDGDMERLLAHAGMGIVVTCQDNGIVSARGIRSGKVIWRAIGYDSEGGYFVEAFLTRLPAHGAVVVVVGHKAVSLLRALDGSVLYRVIVSRNDIDLASAYLDRAHHRLITCDDDNHLRACDLTRRCEELWTDRASAGDGPTKLALCCDTVVALRRGKREWVRSFDTGTGPVTPKTALPEAVVAGRMLGHADSDLLILYEPAAGKLWSLRARTLDVLAEHQVHVTGGISASLSGTMLQVSTERGISFLDARTLQPLSAAPFDAPPSFVSTTLVRLQAPQHPATALEGALAESLRDDTEHRHQASTEEADLGAPGAGWSPFPVCVGCVRCHRRSTQRGLCSTLSRVFGALCGDCGNRNSAGHGDGRAIDPTHALVLGGSGEVFIVDVPLFLGPFKFAPSIDMAEIASLKIDAAPQEDDGGDGDGADAQAGKPVSDVTAKAHPGAEEDELQPKSVDNPLRASLRGGVPVGLTEPDSAVGEKQLDPPLACGQSWRLYQPAIRLIADVVLALVSFMQLIAFAFQPAVPPSLEESATILDEVQSLGLGQITFGVVFFCAIGAVLLFFLLLAVSEQVEEAKYRNPGRLMPNLCWTGSAVFVSLATTVAQIPIWKILAQAFACAPSTAGSDQLVWSASPQVACLGAEQIGFIAASSVAGVILLPVAIRMLSVSAQLDRLELVWNPFDWSGDDTRAEPPDHALSEASRHYPTVLVVLKATFSMSAVLLASRPVGFGLILLGGTLVQLAVVLIRPPHYFSEGNKFEVIQVAAFVFQNAVAVSAATVEFQEASRPDSASLANSRLLLSWSPLGLLVVIVMASLVSLVTPPLLPHVAGTKPALAGVRTVESPLSSIATQTTKQKEVAGADDDDDSGADDDDDSGADDDDDDSGADDDDSDAEE